MNNITVYYVGISRLNLIRLLTIRCMLLGGRSAAIDDMI